MKRVIHEFILAILAFLRHLVCSTRNCDEEQIVKSHQNGGENDDNKPN